MRHIIETKQDLVHAIEERLGSEGRANLAEKLADGAWDEAQKLGYEPGSDWAQYLDSVDWMIRGGCD